MNERSIYEFTMNDIDNNPVTFEKFRNKVLLIVNVASILKPVWFLAFQKTKPWLQLYSGKMVFGKIQKPFWDEYKLRFSEPFVNRKR